MSKALFLRDKDFEWFLSSAAEWLPEAVEDALRAGAAVLAAEMKANLRKKIVDKQATQLVDSFGITPVGQDRQRVWNVHLGFDGYQTPGTGKWAASGIPFQMIARVFESGSVKKGYQWRKPKHFARDAVRAKRQQAEEAMKNAAEAAISAAKKKKGG